MSFLISLAKFIVYKVLHVLFLSPRNYEKRLSIARDDSLFFIGFLYCLIAVSYTHLDFFWELATLIVIMLLGHWIEMRAVGNAGNALRKMAELLPGSAHLVGEHGETEDVPRCV